MRESEHYMKFQRHLLNSPFFIYGCGRVAVRFYKILEKKKMLYNFKGFVVSGDILPNNVFMGNPVCRISDISLERRRYWIMIATSAVHLQDIVALLKELQFKKYEWIYTYLYDLYFGPPVQFDVALSVTNCLKFSREKNWIAVCYYAIKSAFEGNEDGEHIYTKLSSCWFTPDMAKKDYQRFIETVNSMIHHGYSQEYNIQVSTDCRYILDGSHRIALAMFFQTEKVIANMYEVNDEAFVNFLGNPALLYTFSDEMVCNCLGNEDFKKIRKICNDFLDV